MKLHDSTAQKIPVEMRIYLSSSNRSMAQHFLYGAEVSTTLDKMRSKGVPECMRADGFLQADLSRAFFDDIEDHDA